MAGRQVCKETRYTSMFRIPGSRTHQILPLLALGFCLHTASSQILDLYLYMKTNVLQLRSSLRELIACKRYP